MQNYIEIGKIYREHGLKGLCKVYIFSSSDDNLNIGNEYLLRSEQGKTLKTKLISVSVVKKFFLLQFDCFAGADQILPWRKASLLIHKSLLQKEDDEIFAFEWIGYEVFDSQKNKLGKIKDVIYNPLPQFILERDKREIFVPWVKEWIIKNDIENKTLVLDLPEGLIEV